MPQDNDPFDPDSQLENDADRGFSNHDLAQQAYHEAHEARIAGPDRRQNYSKSRLFAAGFAVMPLDPAAKKPFFSFTPFTGPLSRPLTPTEVTDFYNKAQRENSNAGLLLDHPTDPGSSLCVVDVDEPGGENGDLTFVKLWLKSWGLDYREMVTVSTGREGGGFHFYARREAAHSAEYAQQNGGKVFTRTDVPLRNKITREIITDPVTGVILRGPGSKVDCKAVRAYVVCPGAIHHSGVEYVATRNGVPVESLASVLHLIPVLPYAAWEEMRLPPTLATFERMQRAANPPYNFPLPFDLVKNRNYAEVVAAAKEGRAVVAPVKDALPEGMEQSDGSSYTNLTPKPGKTFVTVFHPTSHPAYAVFLPLVGRYTKLAPTETDYRCGTEDHGRQVSLGENGALIVKDWVYSILHVFTDRAHKPAKKLPGAPKAIPAYLLAQDLGPAEGRWTGRVEPIVLTALGFLPTMDGVKGAHVEVWQSTQGTGKTEQMKLISDEARNNGKRVVFVVPIRTLAAQAATRLALPHYAEAGGPITDSVVVTNVSLKRVTMTPVDLLSDAPSVNDNGVFFIDECEQVLDQVHKLGRAADGIAQRNVLIAHVQASARVILSDADAGPLTLAFLKDAGLLDVSVWRKSDARHPRTYVYCPGRPSVHKLEIIKAVSEGAKVAVAVMSRKTGESFAQLAATRLPGKNILLVAKSTILDGKVDLSTLNDNLAPVDLLIYTPVMGTGVSLDIKGHFDRVDLIATNRAGDGRQAMQMVMRVRHPASTVVRVSGANCSEPFDAEKTRDFWHQTFTHQNAINLKMMAKVKNARQISKDFEGWTPDLNVSKQNARHFLAACESVAAGRRHGSSWVTRYLCGDDVEIDPKMFDTDEAKLASAEESAIRDDQADAEAAKVAAVDPSSLVVLEQDNPALPEEQKECIRYARLLGAKWELATEADRKALVRDDESGALTGEVHSFAATLAWSKNEDGKDSVMIRDEKDLDQSTEDRRRNRSSKAALTTKVLKLLGIDLHAPADVVIDPVLAAQVCALVSTWTEYLHTDVKLPKNWKDEPMRYPSKVLATVGLKLESQQIRLPKEQGGNRLRVYTLLKSDVERMVALAAHQSLCLYRRESNIGTPGEIAFEAGGRTSARDFDEDAMLAMVYAA